MSTNSRAPRPGDAETTSDALAIAQQTLDDIVAVLFEHSGRAGHLIAPFMVAAGAAADGRDAVTAAPSLPANSGHQPSPQRQSLHGASPAGIADTLGEVARVLATQLAAAVGTASDPRDREALTTARRCAETIHSCLAGTG